jgi:hypothetical protein
MNGIQLKLREQICPYKVFGIFAMPGERIPLEVMNPDHESHYVLSGPQGKITTAGHAKWVWQAPPQPGLFPLVVRHKESETATTLNVFVMIPYERLKGGYLQNYRIGRYPKADSGKAGVSCEPPRGFVAVTEANGDTPISPHFRLKQFLCKQKGGYPKFVVLSERLILKLEYLLERVNDAGYPCTTFTIMSGYRTPYYNRAIGNVTYSRHMWGEAADIFVDHRPKDNLMDDLNRDGTVDWKDAKVLCRIIEGLCGTESYEPFIGGLGAYEKTPSHGPFIHVDVRGCRARWGK